MPEVVDLPGLVGAVSRVHARLEVCRMTGRGGGGSGHLKLGPYPICVIASLGTLTGWEAHGLARDELCGGQQDAPPLLRVLVLLHVRRLVLVLRVGQVVAQHGGRQAPDLGVALGDRL